MPLVELNHLELQFLLLNDFRLAISVEELEAYGTMLVEFYAREIVAQQQQQQRQQHPASVRTIPINPSLPPEYSAQGMLMRPHEKHRDGSRQIHQNHTPPY